MTTTDTTDAITSVQGQELRQFIERHQRLDGEKKDITDAQKEGMAEAKGRGYCVQTLKVVLSLRKKTKDEIDESEALLETYRNALGM